jgi:NitT/TauT family transport system ATP-binding protein
MDFGPVKKLEAKNLTLSYRSERTGGTIEALKNITFDLEPGEFVSVVGPSGCGKSTLLSIIDGLLPATDGAIVLDGKQVSEPGRDRALVFQEASLLPWRSVFQNVKFGLECHRIGGAEAKERALSLIRLVGLEGFANAYPYELSGGMQQRVNLARALAVNPELLLMDEPFAALDAQTREVMQAELLRVWERTKKTVLFVTHQIDEAIYLSDRVIVLSSRPGRIIEIIAPNLPRPRTLAMKHLPEFHVLMERIWSLIQTDKGQRTTDAVEIS